MNLLTNRKKHIPVHTKNNILTFVKQQVILVFALCMVFAVSTNAQAVDGWEKIYDRQGGLDELTSVIQTKDEGFLMVGSHTVQTPYIIKTDPDGDILWEQSYGQANPMGQLRDIVEVADGNYVAVGWEASGNRDVFVVKINDAGEQIWANTYGGSTDNEAFSVTATADGGIAVVGFTEDQFLEKQVYLLKIDTDGVLEWEESYGNNYDDSGNGVIEDTNGDLVIAGYTELNVNVSVALLLKVDATGTLQFFNQIAGNVATDLVQTANGYALSGYGTIASDLNARLTTTDVDGNQVTTDFFGEPNFVTEFRSIAQTRDGNLILSGISEISATDIEGYVVKTNAIGDEVWEKTFGRSNTPDFFNAVAITFRDEIIMVGSHFDSPLSFDSDFYIVKANTEGNIFSNYIIGNVFRDLNNNCDFDPSDTPIEGWIIEAVSDEGTCYGASDANGDYTILVSTGSYMIQPRFPNDYWNTCIESQTINFNAPDDTLHLDFASFIVQPCTDIEVDMTTLGLTPSGTTDYLITYCNNGTSTALTSDLYVDVEFDDSYTINSSTPLFSVIGEIIRFENLPELGPFDCGEIVINVTVDGVDGETHSARAHAYPDEFCGVNYTGPSLEVDTDCVGGEVRLTVRNVGLEGLVAATDFVIVEDMFLLTVPVTGIGAGQDTVITMPATGPTYRIIAEQVAGHPGDSRPSEAIEGCVVGGGSFTTGAVNELPENDYDHFLSVDCQENETTLDNESRGYPKGYGSEHFIQQCADLKYHHRFFYTGPDTALRVVIRDTLSPFLDPASVRPGVSNHEYTMDVYGCGILSFTFENINLTGGSADPDESSIFVKYRVSQKLDNPGGSIVDNSAAAYFDFQSPIKTDSIFHTTDTIEGCDLSDFIEVIVSTDEILLDGVEDVNVYPNPFVDQATVEVVADRKLKDLSFKLYDVSGRMLRNESFTGMTYQLNRSGLTSGMYFYKIESQGIPVSSGKLLAK